MIGLNHLCKVCLTPCIDKKGNIIIKKERNITTYKCIHYNKDETKIVPVPKSEVEKMEYSWVRKREY